jgi:hypothetical protein
MAENEEPKVPTITLRMTDPEKFAVEINFETPTPQYARAMLNEALYTIESLIEDQNAVAFQSKMTRAQQAFQAMRKSPNV